MPLGEVMTNFGEHWQKKAARGSNGRSVKRLRVGRLDHEEDKENIEYVPSKWDETAPAGSPKRKCVGFVAVNAATLKTGNGEGGNECDGGVQEEYPATSPPDSTVAVWQAIKEEVASPNRVEGNDLGTEVAELSQDVSDRVNLPGQSEESDQTFTLEPAPSPSDAAPSEALLESAIQQAKPTENEADPASSTRQSTNQLTTIPADQDDTAYLHDFLSRARAQKAAKQQAMSQEQDPTAPMDGIETTATSPESPAACDMEDVSESKLDTAVSQDEIPSLEPDIEADPMMTSPRRSSRLITRLPRPQKSVACLPSNIALKRLNGTEFIAMQRETQSLALTTRTNTKRNKGDAVGVQHKLMQLAAEERARVVVDGVGQGAEVPAKKRKKKAKEVSWDSTIARYEGGEAVVNADGEEGEQEDENETPVEAERDGKENEDGQEGKNENKNGEVPKELEKNQVRKVRRLRKLNVGNVNGTPAPKRRISLGIPVPVGSSSSSSSTVEKREDKEDVDASEGGRQSSGAEKRMQTRTRTSTRKP